MGRPIRPGSTRPTLVNLIVGLSYPRLRRERHPTVIVGVTACPPPCQIPGGCGRLAALREVPCPGRGGPVSLRRRRAFVAMWMNGPPQSAGTGPRGRARPSLNASDPPRGTPCRMAPRDGRGRLSRRWGRQTSRPWGAARRGLRLHCLAVGLRVSPDRGQPMEAGTKWFALTEELLSTLRGI